MVSNMDNEFKKIVDGWTKKNSNSITRGINVSSPKDMLKFERTLMFLLIQLGGLIMAWIIKTKVEDHDFQKVAAREIIPSGPKKNSSSKDMISP